MSESANVLLRHKNVVAALFFFLIYALPLSVIGVFDKFVSGKTVPQWLDEKGWPSVKGLALIWLVIAIALSVAFYVLLSASSWFLSKRKKRAELKAHTPITATDKQLCFIADTHETIRVTVNSRHFWTSLAFLDTGSYEKGWGIKDFPVRVYTKPNSAKPYVDTKIYSSEMGIIEVKRNRLAVVPKDWDENSNSRAVEIVNEHGIPVFQATLSAANQLDIDAVFSEAQSKNGWRMEPLFKYPSKDHSGEFSRDFGLLPLDAQSLYQLFLTGCGGGNGTAHGGYRLESPGANKFTIDYVICSDTNSKGTYFNVFMPKYGDTAEMLKIFAREYTGFLKPHLEHTSFIIRMNPGEPPERVTGLVFTGVIGIYHEDYLLPEEPEEIRAEFAKHGASVRFFGPDYVVTMNSPILKQRGLGRRLSG